MNLHEKIKAARAALGLTQEAFGALLGVSGATVSRWEDDTPPTFDNLKGLASLMGVPLESLVDMSTVTLNLPELPPSHRRKRRLEAFLQRAEQLYADTHNGKSVEWTVLEHTLSGLLAKTARRPSSRANGQGRS